MPVTDVIDVDDAPDGVTEHTNKLFAVIEEHRAELRELKAWRARTARERRRALMPAKKFVLDLQDDPVELCRVAARGIMDVIAADAVGDAWRGEVELLGDPDAKGKPNVLASVKVELSAGAPMPKPTKDDELVGVLGALRETIKGLGEVVVKIGHAKADEVGAYTTMVTAVAQSVTQRGTIDAKYDFKKHKESEETERVREESHERAARSAHRWAAFEVFAEEWSGVAEIWSQYFASGQREAPKRPTVEEINAVFNAPELSVEGVPWSEIFDPIRAIVAEMIAETDVKRRCKLAKTELRKAINALSKPQQDAMKLRMLSVLGGDRCKEVSAWLSLPVS